MKENISLDIMSKKLKGYCWALENVSRSLSDIQCSGFSLILEVEGYQMLSSPVATCELMLIMFQFCT